MTQLDFSSPTPYGTAPATSSLADILERVLDKGIVIAGDIKIDLLDIELLTIRLRLFVSSVETARKAGIDWWETDPALSSRAARLVQDEEKEQLRERVAELERDLHRALDEDRSPDDDRALDRSPDRERHPDRARKPARDSDREPQRGETRERTSPAPRRTRRQVSG